MRDFLIAAAIVAMVAVGIYAWSRRGSRAGGVIAPAPNADAASLRFASDVKQRFNEINTASPFNLQGVQSSWRQACAQVEARWNALGWGVPGGACDPRIVGLDLSTVQIGMTV